MKKYLAAFLAVLMVLNLSVTALAVSLTPAADKETITAGDSVTVSVKTDEEIADVTTAELRLYFDDTKFEWDQENSKAVADNISFYAKVCDNNGRKYVRILFIAESAGKATLGTDKLAEVVFKAKADVTEAAQASFSSYIAKLVVNGAEPETDVSIEASISVTVTPASTEPEGYAVAASAVAKSVTVNEDAQVALKISNKDVETYNAYYMEVSYDTSVLAYKSITPAGATVTDDGNGNLKIAGYGEDKKCDTDNIVLTFTSKAVGEAKVTVNSAKVDAKVNAAVQDAPGAKLLTEEATITVGGYKVSLPDDFTGAGTANPGEDYTFTAKDKDKKYDFSGSTMGGETVDIIDNGDGTYTVKNVTGPLTITATALASKVTIEETGNGWDDVTNRTGWKTSGDQVEEGASNLAFVIQPTNDRTYVVTANGTTIEGTPMQGGMMYRYAIPADLVKGEKLTINVTYTEPGTDTITIIESGDAWGDVKVRGTWPEGGGTINKSEADAEFSLAFRPATGKTVDDYVVTINGTVMTPTKSGKNYTVSFNPSKVAVNDVVTIDVSYVKVPEPTITVDVTKYLELNGQTMFLITASCADLATDKLLAYDGNAMYWSEKYNAYAWLVISSDDLETVKAAVTNDKFKTIDATDSNKVSIAYEGDVNLTGATDINDAQLVWNMYNAEYSDFVTVNVRKFLEADMTADGVLNTADSAAIVALFTNN